MIRFIAILLIAMASTLSSAQAETVRLKVTGLIPGQVNNKQIMGQLRILICDDVACLENRILPEILEDSEEASKVVAQPRKSTNKNRVSILERVTLRKNWSYFEVLIDNLKAGKEYLISIHHDRDKDNLVMGKHKLFVCDGFLTSYPLDGFAFSNDWDAFEFGNVGPKGDGKWGILDGEGLFFKVKKGRVTEQTIEMTYPCEAHNYTDATIEASKKDTID